MHQVLPEQGFAMPGKLIIGADSHSCTYGRLSGLLPTGVGLQTWPRFSQQAGCGSESRRHQDNGRRKTRKSVSAKDITLFIIRMLALTGKV